MSRGEFRINEEIRARRVRLVDDAGNQLGQPTIEEARAMALERNLDLVEVAPEAEPPVCRLMDYGKYKYEQKKKTQQGHKKAHVVKIKEIRLRPMTEDHDFLVKVKHAKDFISHGDKVLVNMVFRGRQVVHAEIGRELMLRFGKELEGLVKVEKPMSMDGTHLTMCFTPK
ncbi:MAG: translation initiation factor IF-3 [Planctomycetes bacterium]|nr:translation initiation factor IF-3 [Planctomycetota bacterium]